MRVMEDSVHSPRRQQRSLPLTRGLERKREGYLRGTNTLARNYVLGTQPNLTPLHYEGSFPTKPGDAADSSDTWHGQCLFLAQVACAVGCSFYLSWLLGSCADSSSNPTDGVTKWRDSNKSLLTVKPSAEVILLFREGLRPCMTSKG